MCKKRIIIFAFTTIIVTICFCCIKIVEYGSLVHLVKNNQPLYNIYPVKAYLDDDNYVVVVFENGKAVKSVKFSGDRQAINTIRIKLTDMTNIEQYLGKTLDDIEAEFGSYHVDIGSGFFMPSYITTDAYLICFTIEAQHGNIIHVGKTDLFTGEGNEWYLLTE